MKIKITIALLTFTIIGMIIYFEQNNNPYANFTFITNNTQQTLLQATDNNINIALPNLELNLVNNQKINIHDIKSDNIIIHFWASWCGVCTNEFEDIVQFSKNHVNTTVITISIDDDQDKLQNFISLLKRKHDLDKLPNLLFAWDKDKNISINVFNTDMVPENYIVKHHDSHYEITKKIIGKTNWHEIL
jgi:thiol-disulfide isomerase/thioredoxin